MQPNSVVFSEALTQYLSTKGVIDNQQELSKFIRWCGRDRNVIELTPQEAASYGEFLSNSSGKQDTTERVQAIKLFLSFCHKRNFTQASLAKHVRGRKGSRKPRIPVELARPSLDITHEGYQKLLDELESLIQERVVVAKEINLAAADKDFRENAPLDAARERQGYMEARIRELEDGIQRARLTDTNGGTVNVGLVPTVRLGCTVKLIDSSSKEEMIYTIVNASEASPMDFKMSVASPVGKALMDHVAGEEVRVNTPRGTLQYRIEKIG
jgi:transcription elongation factor GreA